MSLRILRNVKGVTIQVILSKMNFNMQTDCGVCPEAVQLVHHFLLAANNVDLGKSINLQEL